MSGTLWQLVKTISWFPTILDDSLPSITLARNTTKYILLSFVLFLMTSPTYSYGAESCIGKGLYFVDDMSDCARLQRERDKIRILENQERAKAEKAAKQFYSKNSVSTFDVVVSGRKCQESTWVAQQLDCEYQIGKDLSITVGGIGEDDTAVTFNKVDSHGDYYATFGLMHSCVIVKPGLKTKHFFDFAFISPRTGKVFRSWRECQGH